MTQTEQLYQDALRLSDEDRLNLADRLLGSLPDGFQTVVGDNADWHGELLRRAGDREGAVSWDQLREQLRPLSWYPSNSIDWPPRNSQLSMQG